MEVWTLLVVITVVGLVLLVVISRHHTPSINRQLVATRWQKIIDYAKQGEAGQRQAIIEADKLVDFVLREYRVSGKTMAERMRASEQLIPNYQQLWDAHKVRNKIAHEDSFKLDKKTVQTTLRSYQATLKGMKAL